MTDKPVSRNAYVITTWAQQDSNDAGTWKDACVVIGTAKEARAKMVELDREFREKHSAAPHQNRPSSVWCVTQTDLHMPGKEEDDLYEAIIEQMRDSLRKCQLPPEHMRYSSDGVLHLHCESDEQRTAIYKMLRKPSASWARKASDDVGEPDKQPPQKTVTSSPETVKTSLGPLPVSAESMAALDSALHNAKTDLWGKIKILQDCQLPAEKIQVVSGSGTMILHCGNITQRNKIYHTLREPRRAAVSRGKSNESDVLASVETDVKYAATGQQHFDPTKVEKMAEHANKMLAAIRTFLQAATQLNLNQTPTVVTAAILDLQKSLEFD